MHLKRILICCCADYQLLPEAAIRELAGAASEAGLELHLLADLCGQISRAPQTLVGLVDASTAVAACATRAVTALLARTTLQSGPLLNLRSFPVARHLAALGLPSPVVPFPGALPCYEADWRAWFPVIDRNRCTACGKCVDFCLFGVYRRESGSIQAAVPENCKTGCPACARMCPRQAIIFPKHDESVINGCAGDSESAVAAPDREGQPPSPRPENPFAGDLYGRLAARRRGRHRRLLKDD